MMNAAGRPTDTLGTCGTTDECDRLLSADAALAELQERCGGDLPGTIAIPELLALVSQARRMGLRIAREFSAFDGDSLVGGFVRIHPLGDAGGGGCELLIESWQRRSLPVASDRDFAARIDTIDRAAAEVSALLDARQRVLVLSAAPADAAALEASVKAAPGTLWSDHVELIGIAHRQPLHWRLLDGAMCRLAGSQREWRVRLIPQGGDPEPSGFELLLIADEPLALQPAEMPAADADAGDMPPATRLVGTALTPVLRQPIARIIANAETIRARLAGPLRDEYTDRAGTIAAAGQHLSAMLDDLADLEVVESPDFAAAQEAVDLADAAQRAAGILGMKAQNRDTRLIVEGQRGEAVACAEFRRVLQILLNLIGNAIAYSPAGSTVHITAAAGEGRASLLVADEGPGVRAEQADRIFDKYDRGGRDSDGGRDKGTGLGLFISRRLAEAMGGTLTVENASGGGAVFKLELPPA